MQKTNWETTDTYLPLNMNALEEEIKADDTAVTNHISDEWDPHQVTKEQIGLGLVENISDLDWPLTSAQMDYLENYFEKNLVDLPNDVFKSKCEELGIGGTEVIPDNITRIKVIILSYNSSLQNVDIVYYKYADLVTDEPLASVNVSIIDGDGYIDVDPDFYYSIASVSVPVGYDTPKTTLRFYAEPGKLKTAYLYYGEPTPIKYSISIDETNSNSDTSVTYGNDCVSYTAAKTVTYGTSGAFGWTWGSWLDKWPFNEIKPCLLRNKSEFDGKSEVLTYLDPYDYTKDIDGTDITNIIENGSDGYFDIDVMVEFPADINIYINKTIDNKIIISIQKGAVVAPLGVEKSKWNYYNDSPISKLYISAYRPITSLNNIETGKLKSLSNQKIYTINARDFVKFAHNKGIGYEPINAYQVEMLKVLYLLLCKNLNSQEAFGLGCGYGLGDSTKTGVHNQAGMYFGNPITESLNKMFGIEGLASGRGHFIWGAWIENNKIHLKTGDYENYSLEDESNDYLLPSSNGYITKMSGKGNSGLILPSSNGGSATTYYGDYNYVSSDASGEKLYLVWNRNDNTNNLTRLGMFGLRFIDETEWLQNNYISYFVYNMF